MCMCMELWIYYILSQSICLNACQYKLRCLKYYIIIIIFVVNFVLKNHWRQINVWMCRARPRAHAHSYTVVNFISPIFFSRFFRVSIRIRICLIARSHWVFSLSVCLSAHLYMRICRHKPNQTKWQKIWEYMYETENLLKSDAHIQWKVVLYHHNFTCDWSTNNIGNLVHFFLFFRLKRQTYRARTMHDLPCGGSEIALYLVDVIQKESKSQPMKTERQHSTQKIKWTNFQNTTKQMK